MKMKNHSILLSLAMLLPVTFLPPAAHAANATYVGNDIVIGTGTTNSVPNIKIGIETSSAGVSVSFLVANALTAEGGTSAGSYTVGATNVLKVSSAPSEGIYARTQGSSFDTGIINNGTSNVGAFNSNPQFFAANAMGGNPGGVILCLELTYYYASNSSVNLWHCSSQFNWPEPLDSTPPAVISGGPDAPQISADGLTLTIQFSEGMSAATSPSGFTVTQNNVNVPMTVGNISQGGNSLTFTFASPFTSMDSNIKLNYSPGSLADDAASPNSLAAFGPYGVVNGSSVTSAGSVGGSSEETPTPAKYSGPEFSGLSGMGITTGSTGKLEGKRLNEISSIEIGGKAATFTATSATELELSLPAGLAPGLYDLVINSSAGKLTHISAIQVREPKKSFSITTRSTGKISNDQYIEHSLIASMQIPELNKARCVVNADSIAMARAMANRLCAVVKASNPNIETTIVEPRSTVKGDAVYARVSYGWN
jgi:hypothetical protein